MKLTPHGDAVLARYIRGEVNIRDAFAALTDADKASVRAAALSKHDESCARWLVFRLQPAKVAAKMGWTPRQERCDSLGWTEDAQLQLLQLKQLQWIQGKRDKEARESTAEHVLALMQKLTPAALEEVRSKL